MLLVNKELLNLMTTNSGDTVFDISIKKPVLLVFLRHFGCQFCREAMDELSKLQSKFLQHNIELVFVHMTENGIADDYFTKFNFLGVQHISDPFCRYYAAFGLVKGSLTQLFGLQSWIRGFTTLPKYGSEMDKQLGDSFQMPGAFMIFEGELRDSYIHKRASDRPDYLKLAVCCDV
jgi:thiol-disulfide isomerase/thioredoxin